MSTSCSSPVRPRPDYKTIGEFRRRHLVAFGRSFIEVLALCDKAGLVKLGRVALDGTKIAANASRHKAMSYDRMVEREAELAAQVAAILREAEATDAARTSSMAMPGATSYRPSCEHARPPAQDPRGQRGPGARGPGAGRAIPKHCREPKASATSQIRSPKIMRSRN